MFFGGFVLFCFFATFKLYRTAQHTATENLVLANYFPLLALALSKVKQLSQIWHSRVGKFFFFYTLFASWAIINLPWNRNVLVWCRRQFLAKLAGLVIRDNLLFLSVHPQKIITVVAQWQHFYSFLPEENWNFRHVNHENVTVIRSHPQESGHKMEVQRI